MSNSQPFFSVVIPVRDEEQRIVPALERLSSWADTEIIVALDSNSRDASAARAAGVPGVRVLAGAGTGRGAALESGARAARGRVLLFLHADCRLEAAAVRAATARLDKRTVAVAFRMRLDSPRWVFRLLEAGVNLRSRFLSLPYGDQGLLLTRETLDRVGGFRPFQKCEDLDLVLRLRKLGRVALAAGRCTVSTRRWDRDGVLKVTASNLLTLTRFLVTGAASDDQTMETIGPDPTLPLAPLRPRVDRDPGGPSVDGRSLR